MRANPGNMGNMMRKMQKMQKEMQSAQAELEVKEYTSTSADDLIKVTMTGKHEIKDISIDAKVIDPDDPEMLQDLLIETLNQVLTEVDQDTENTMGKYTRGLM
ncbi:YbaB/EbfC family nucleoid-associated protein [Lapidilactobacillus mulanensis]|uniref:Nucleoid-associated protein ACFQ4L_10140 n=1 Tax=Lapidilactobacillus mulanensis TaxID=2485999 RepID=A0ABW4DP57_9LACO|nr:YbaB/EbfC family nucleoid-associated protein [Lapidilactobacillus mulanensis]